MSSKVQLSFSTVVEQFLAQYCLQGDELQVTDRKLFPAFRAFWMGTTPHKNHPALLGQFRVVMTEKGFVASGGKRPRWHGLALIENNIAAEKEIIQVSLYQKE